MEVVRNVPFRKVKKQQYKKTKNTHLSGCYKSGRGLELAIESLVYLNDYKLLIVGDGQGLDELKELAEVGWSSS